MHTYSDGELRNLQKLIIFRTTYTISERKLSGWSVGAEKFVYVVRKI
jgi:hypothetical protein